jgi:mannose-6-phosphate isomerase-like protein (cupin superfamily)
MSIYSERARYVPVEQGFNIKRPPIEPHAFIAEMTRAFADDAGTAFIPLDLSPRLCTDYAATTPFMLVRYARVRERDTLACTLAASGEMWVVLRGKGYLKRGDEIVNWTENDVLALPGGSPSVWRSEEDAILWVVTDEPMLAFAGVRPEVVLRAPIEATHYRAHDIARELRALYDRPMMPDTPGRALFMATERTAKLGTCLPSMTLTLNAVRPGESQRPHRHNAAALVLALREAKCASTIGGQKFPWTPHVTLLTPAGVEHDHCNALEMKGKIRDEDIGLALIVQDGGLYYYGRTMGFAFA